MCILYIFRYQIFAKELYCSFLKFECFYKLEVIKDNDIFSKEQQFHFSDI